jgi:hypothetical protein
MDNKHMGLIEKQGIPLSSMTAVVKRQVQTADC